MGLNTARNFWKFLGVRDRLAMVLVTIPATRGMPKYWKKEGNVTDIYSRDLLFTHNADTNGCMSIAKLECFPRSRSSENI
jgi:hypothetical protein